MQALRIIADEHRSLAAVLHAVHLMLRKISADKTAADLKLLRAMVHFLDACAEQRHHPKEDILFAYLKARTSEADGALATLAAEHAAAPNRIAALHQALDEYALHPDALPAFAAAFETYADFYRSHMLLEEEVALPAARKYLLEADWREVDERFCQAAQPATASPENFDDLFSRLVAYAPIPIGLGAGPYPD
ncbi:MAG: hemerythrin domain-containing protein [Betaproteobacteria bacterium]|nr:hemerythrin domain-containing protein [Betaproteobacteria bacterium]